MQESEKIKDLCKKWNSICSSVHKKPHFLEKVFNLSSSSSPSSSTSVSTSDHQNKSKIQRSLLNWPGVFEGEVCKPAAKPELLSNPNSSPNSASSSEASGQDMKLFPPHNLDELNPDNLDILTAALENKVPWQKHIIPQVATTILKCRSGSGTRRESWLLFSGSDHKGKEIMAKEVAKIVFGCDEEFVGIGISNFSGDSTEEVVSNKKRGRDEHGWSVYNRFSEAVRDNPSRVFFIEDVDHLDRRCLKEFERAMGNGGVSGSSDGEALPLKDAIVIFSCESVEHGKSGKDEDDEEKQCGPLDLNIATEDRGVGMLDSVDMQVEFRIQSVVN